MFSFSHCFESKTAKRTIFRHRQQRKGSNCTHLNAWIKICIIYPTSLLAWCVDESWRQNKFSLSIMIFLVIFHRCCNIIWTSMPPIVFLYQPRRFACHGTSSNHVKLSRTMQMAFACIYYRNRGSPLAAASTALGRQLSADDFSFVSSKFCTRPWEFSQDPRELSVNFSFQHHSYTSVSGCGTLIMRFDRLALDLYFFFRVSLLFAKRS